MRRCLILANQTLTSDALGTAVRERSGPFYVVAPATTTPEMLAAAGSDETKAADHAYALAQQRLARALEQLTERGLSAEGEVGHPDPVQAVTDALERLPAEGEGSVEEVVVATLPRHLSQWLRRDVPARLRRATDVPVTHVTTEADATTAS